MELHGLQLLKATTNISKLATDLGISRIAIYKWTKVPAKWLIQIERQTGIPRQDLRPDLYEGMKNE
jgi:DNA-binding transcriptional regulator YdaS (Cro superfamily)